MNAAVADIDDYPPRARAWILVGLLCAAGAVSNIDRGILNLLVDPVRRDLRISDVQIGLLQGLSFGLFYATIGIPLGMVADRVSRRALLLVGITAWSLATVLGGLAPSYGWMFASRLLVGLGEATLGPCALSLIGDLFPPGRRGRPISVHLMGGSIGGGLGVIMVGFITDQALRGRFDGLPFAHGAAPWRIAFVIAGLLGLVLVALLAAQREPRRLGPRTPAVVDRLAASRGFLRDNLAVFAPFYLAFGMLAIAAWGTIAWAPTFVMRRFGLSAAAVGNPLGVSSLVAGIAGALIAGIVLDSGFGRAARTRKLTLLMLLPLLYLPAVFAAFAPSSLLAIVLSSLIYLLFPMMTTVTLSAIADMVPNDLRGVSVSFVGLTSTLIGQILGPYLVAAATEHLFHDPALVGRAIMLVAAPALILASSLYGLSRQQLLRKLRSGGSLSLSMAVQNVPAVVPAAPGGD